MGRHNVVVGVDSSAASRSALEWAAAEAVVRSAPLYSIHCYTPEAVAQPPGAAGAPRCSSDIVRAAAEYARGRYPGLSSEGMVIHRSPAAGLIRASRSAAILVIGTCGHGLGSTTSELLAGSACPTVLVPAGRAQRNAQHVVAVIQVLDHCETIVEFAISHAALHDLPLRIVTERMNRTDADLLPHVLEALAGSYPLHRIQLVGQAAAVLTADAHAIVVGPGSHAARSALAAGTARPVVVAAAPVTADVRRAAGAAT